MTDISMEKLLKFNREGLIPGPNETEIEFEHRVGYCFQLKHQIFTELKDQIPFSEEELDQENILVQPLIETQKTYDIAPHWVPLFFSNQKLTPWHGGCAWIFKTDNKSPTSAFLQLRKAFKSAPTYLGLYKRDDLIAHEFCHIGRMMFEEPKFEEILANRVSESKFRQWFGGLFQSGYESALFVFVLGLVILLDLGLFLSGEYQLYASLMWTKLLPLCVLVYFTARLFKRHSTLNQTLNKLKSIFQGQASSVLFRLTDAEIISFAKMPLDKIRDYIKSNQDQTLRWKIIVNAYH